VNLIVEDGAMWLANVQTQLVFNLEKTQGQDKENVDEHQKEQLGFKVEDWVWLRQ
jgi:hypothetical protein